MPKLDDLPKTGAIKTIDIFHKGSRIPPNIYEFFFLFRMQVQAQAQSATSVVGIGLRLVKQEIDGNSL
jgi:hypothetical protein